MGNILEDLYAVVKDRQENPQEGSYTCYLFDKGLDKILKRSGRKAPKRLSPQKTAAMRRRSARSPISCTMSSC